MKSCRFNKCLEIIRQGNPRGIEDIYYTYYEKIKYASFILLKDEYAAEDIASAILKYILENIDKIPFVEHPDAWILKMSHSFSVDYIRKYSRTTSLDSLADSIPAQNSDDILRLSFLDCFLKLTETEQKVLVLHYMYGYKYKEISRILEIPVGTVKSDVSIIKSKLKYLKKI